MKRIFKVGIVSSFFIVLLGALSSLSIKQEDNSWVSYCKSKFLNDAGKLKSSTAALHEAIDALKANDTQSVIAARKALVLCREDYKRIEYFMEYFFDFPVNMYNKAPVYEIEEPYMEYQSPIGLQVVEDLLFEDNVFEHKQELLEQSNALKTTAGDIPATMFNFQCTEQQLAESIDQELIRVMSLNITGYDAPILKTGIHESGIALETIAAALQEQQKIQGVDSDAQRSAALLQQASYKMLADTSFDQFNRLEITTGYLLPAQQYLNKYFVRLYPAIGSQSVYNYKAAHLYSPDALRKDRFSRYAETDTTAALVALGKQLFSETKLSGNNKRSCATCHKPEKYFTDGLALSIDFTEKGNTKRNAPSLLYSVYQHGQFLDARDSSFEKQAMAVLENPDEMHASFKDMEQKLDTKAYRKLFGKAFKGESHKRTISTSRVLRAIAAYERTLTPFNSAFDRYIAGNKNALNAAQVKGYNLFMGKAQCGSCHFAPIFNGSLPPLYNRTELEVLGTPGNGNVKHPSSDKDSGRYDGFKIPFYQFAFKTPTVRNISETGPYMHNGSFRTLDDLIEFYNQGGGNGIGLHVETQTLSDRKLNLTKAEIADIKAFLGSLKDSIAGY